MSYSLSRYIITTDLEDGRVGILSTISGSVLVVPRVVFHNMSTDSERLSRSLMEGLIKENILVKNWIDEETLVLNSYKKEQDERSSLGITFAPSFLCNMGCKYCYESRKNNTIISKSTFDLFLTFMSKTIRERNVKALTLHLYGGEPLMFSQFFIDANVFLKEKFENLKVSNVLITNGYLLSEKIDSLTSIFDIDAIQVTVHGDENSHNKVRSTLDGKDTYRDILLGIKKALRVGIPKIIIRVNLDLDNCSSLDSLILSLAQYGFLENESLSIYPAFIGDISSETDDYASRCIRRKDYIENSLAALDCLDKHNYFSGKRKKKDYFKQLLFKSHCAAYSKNSYQVGPDGNIGKCLNFIDKNEYSVGNVNDSTPVNQNLEKKWLMSGQERFKSCIKCPIVPACTGGCLSFEKKQKTEDKFCVSEIEDTKLLLKLYCHQFA